MDLIETCRKLISIDSSPTHGTSELVNFIEKLTHGEGFYPEVQKGINGLDGIVESNVLIRPAAGLPKEEFLLQAHLDTIDPGHYSQWTETDLNPFNATIAGDKLIGLGATDLKVDFACKLKALCDLKKSNWRLPFVLVGTFGGETLEMFGTRLLIENKKISAQRGLIGMPSGLKLVKSTNGALVFDLLLPFSEQEKTHRRNHDFNEGTSTHSRLFKGKSAHSSTPELGENAIVKMVKYMERMPDTITVMTLEGGSGYNTVPGEAFLEVDVAGYIKGETAKKLSKLVAELELIATYFSNYPTLGDRVFFPAMNIGLLRTDEEGLRIGVCIRVTPGVDGGVIESWIDRIQKFVSAMGGGFQWKAKSHIYQANNTSGLFNVCAQTLVDLGLHSEPVVKAEAYEASLFSKVGIDAVGFGPGLSVDISHKPNEYNSISQMEKAVQFYRSVIEKSCL